jgi:hypothetical protein
VTSLRFTPIEQWEADPVAQSAACQAAIAAADDVPATVRILAALEAAEQRQRRREAKRATKALLKGRTG